MSPIGYHNHGPKRVKSEPEDKKIQRLRLIPSNEPETVKNSVPSNQKAFNQEIINYREKNIER